MVTIAAGGQPDGLDMADELCVSDSNTFNGGSLQSSSQTSPDSVPPFPGRVPECLASGLGLSLAFRRRWWLMQLCECVVLGMPRG